MKTFWNYVVVMLVLVSAVACQDDETSSMVVSEEEVVDMVATSLAEDNSGMSMVINDGVSTAEMASGGRMSSCGYSESLGLSRSSIDGAIVTFSYEFDYDYQMTCDAENKPESLTTQVSYSGFFDAPRLASSNEGEGDLSITALEGTSTQYLVNGSYSRKGTFESKVHNKNASISDIQIVVNEIAVDKETEEIISGSGAVEITGEVQGVGVFSFEGEIVFEGEGKAILTINGVSYQIDLKSGEVN